MNTFIKNKSSPRNNSFHSRSLLRNEYPFHQTNKDWNQLFLNRSWVIGSLNHLFRKSRSYTPHYWERYYYESGQQRQKLLHQLSPEKQRILQDFTIPYTKQQHLLHFLSEEEIMLNTHYGRTPEELNRIADFFYQEIHHKYPITPSLSKKYVRIRVIDETFIGFQREIKTIDYLRRRYPNCIVREATSDLDSLYAIDCEIYNGQTLLIALQIKSPKYLHSKNSFINSVKQVNKRKNENYNKTFGVPVLYLFATSNGFIVNREVLYELDQIIQKK